MEYTVHCRRGRNTYCLRLVHTRTHTHTHAHTQHTRTHVVGQRAAAETEEVSGGAPGVCHLGAPVVIAPGGDTNMTPRSSASRLRALPRVGGSTRGAGRRLARVLVAPLPGAYGHQPTWRVHHMVHYMVHYMVRYMGQGVGHGEEPHLFELLHVCGRDALAEELDALQRRDLVVREVTADKNLRDQAARIRAPTWPGLGTLGLGTWGWAR